MSLFFSLSRRMFSVNLSFYTQVCHCLTQADQDRPSPLKSLGPCKVGLARPFICPTRSILRLVHRSAETACRNAGYSNSQPRSHYIVCEGRKTHNTCYVFLEALSFLLVSFSLSEPPMYIAMAVPLWEVHYPTTVGGGVPLWEVHPVSYMCVLCVRGHCCCGRYIQMGI